ncbi:hypothetical protein ASPWEDRAFT_99516 [Aspergillus wentii DTO 134E9]|uniref:LYR motif-containing protein Cup1-like N-terminal domain-containing protein n=1 Tax=Aspergillus wentii DTO 134E9 TaxID=1073089 RepID=A0A1L9S3W0_ASPWE|nr:uncharacterized protein ASPWEDRAFT_99516 [Aspergillus wentii DTO 134E9]OJJ41856.1 hypothetical protein ASPWEDRAFT_99516 [Aspergillus wentii DTO 134E9]
MSVLKAVPREHWRHLYRATIRECSYLPDPIARQFMQKHCTERFRRYWNSPELRSDFYRQHRLRKDASKNLSVLQRANQGYSKPLEKILRMSYGRVGKRRWELLQIMLTPEMPENTAAVLDLIQKPTMLEDNWKPPSIVVDLIKSQHSNGLIAQLGVRTPVKTLEPPIPKEDIWGKPLSRSRQRNIRKRWYRAALGSLLPPLPQAELKTLEGLLAGTIAWQQPKKRIPLGLSHQTEQNLTAKFLAMGPEKGVTFREFANGRPHNITHRFMQRLWRRISCLVPREERYGPTQKLGFQWGTIRPTQKLSIVVEPSIFDNVDARGKMTKAQEKQGSAGSLEDVD